MAHLYIVLQKVCCTDPVGPDVVASIVIVIVCFDYFDAKCFCFFLGGGRLLSLLAKLLLVVSKLGHSYLKALWASDHYWMGTSGQFCCCFLFK